VQSACTASYLLYTPANSSCNSRLSVLSSQGASSLPAASPITR
jgi:hypothetical protein